MPNSKVKRLVLSDNIERYDKRLSILRQKREQAREQARLEVSGRLKK